MISKRTKRLFVLTLVVFVVSAVISFAAPGDSNDPLVTLSYITNTLMPSVETKIDQKVDAKIDAALKNFKPETTAAPSDKFILLNVKKNQVIYGDEGTEFVIRSGSGVIIATSNGGIADLTAGVDLPNGTDFPLNHHLLCPRNDSRGIQFKTNGIVLVKGNYTVKAK